MNVADPTRASWEDYADLVRLWGIEEADEHGFTIPCGDHRLSVLVRGGLSEAHYDYLGKCSEEARPVLALAVLRRLVNTSLDWEHILAQEHGPHVQERLPALIGRAGFPAVTAFIRRKVLDYRKKNPRPRMYISVVKSPRWYAPMLCLGDVRWHFRDQDGPTQDLFNALEAGRDQADCWPLWVRLDDLDPDQVHETARYLRKRTGSHLEWYSADDGRLSWSLKQ